MRPTGRTLILAGLGLPLALLPAVIDVRLWPLWPLYLGFLVAALGAYGLLRVIERCRGLKP